MLKGVIVGSLKLFIIIFFIFINIKWSILLEL
jgi:hypothetical protein